MSVAGISSSLFSYLSQSLHSKGHQARQEFQQLGSDLASGNLSAAQSDFANLEQLQTQSSASPSSTSSASATSSSTLTQELQQLAKDLQSGNLTAAQQDYSAVQQQASAVAPRTPHHHHHHSSGGSSSAMQNTVAQEFQQLGQALQSSDLSSAQQAYTTLQQTLASSSS